MPTITIEVSELVLALRKAFDEQGHTQESFADALGVGRQRAANWIKGHNDIDMSRSLQLRIAMMLGITPTEVLELHGFEVSDDVPEPSADIVGDSGAYLNSGGAVFTDGQGFETATEETSGRHYAPVADLTARRTRQLELLEDVA